MELQEGAPTPSFLTKLKSALGTWSDLVLVGELEPPGKRPKEEKQKSALLSSHKLSRVRSEGSKKNHA